MAVGLLCKDQRCKYVLQGKMIMVSPLHDF